MECPVCYQQCVHPVKLPCNHIFCYLCVKGVVTRTRKCAMCRLPISLQYLENPEVIDESDLKVDSNSQPNIIQWFYQARSRGWWLYEERIAVEIEERFKADPNAIFDLQIAGFLYTIDLKHMKQYRKDDSNVSRAIKRDYMKHVTEVQGKAGLRLNRNTNSLASRTVEGSTSAQDTATNSNIPTNSLLTTEQGNVLRHRTSRQASDTVDLSQLVADININRDTDSDDSETGGTVALV